MKIISAIKARFLKRSKPEADRIPMDVMIRLLESKPNFLAKLRAAAERNQN